MKKKKPFVKPELREEASLEEVTLQSLCPDGSLPDPDFGCQAPPV